MSVAVTLSRCSCATRFTSSSLICIFMNGGGGAKQSNRGVTVSLAGERVPPYTVNGLP